MKDLSINFILSSSGFRCDNDFNLIPESLQMMQLLTKNIKEKTYTFSVTP